MRSQDDLKRLFCDELDRLDVDVGELCGRVTAAAAKRRAARPRRTAVGVLAAVALLVSSIWWSRGGREAVAEWPEVLERAFIAGDVAFAGDATESAAPPEWLPGEYAAVADLLDLDARW